METMGDLPAATRRGRGGALTAFLLALAVGSMLTAPRWHLGSFRADELACEEAVAHLERCCGELPAGRVSCTYNEWECSTDGGEYGDGDCGCSGTDTDPPDITPDQSRCLREKSCDRLRTNGTCAAALATARGSLPCQ